METLKTGTLLCTHFRNICLKKYIKIVSKSLEVPGVLGPRWPLLREADHLWEQVAASLGPHFWLTAGLSAPSLDHPPAGIGLDITKTH